MIIHGGTTVLAMKKKDLKKRQANNFTNDSFMVLRGVFPLFTERKKKSSHNYILDVCVEDDNMLFAQAMKDVKKIENDSNEATALTDLPFAKKTVRTSAEDTELFHQAIQKIGTRVGEHTLTSYKEEDVSRAVTSRLRQLKRGTIRISQELDLHGFQRNEAIERLEYFIGNAFNMGKRAVLVITGKGVNSAEGPVLRGAVANWFQKEGREMVAEFCSAPRYKGGSGAFVVFLKRRKGGSGI